MMTFSYTSKCELADMQGQPTTTCTVTTEAESLPDVLNDFAQFLRGSGYHFNGTIEVVEDEKVHP
jgi:hypothetical protein